MRWPRVVQAAIWSSSSASCAVLGVVACTLRNQWRSALAWRARDSACSRKITGGTPSPARSCAATSFKTVLRLGRVGRTACKGVAKLRKGGGERRQQLRPDAVAREPFVDIGRIFNPGFMALAQPVADGRPGDSQKGSVPGQPVALPVLRHGRQAGQPGATRQCQQDGFDLIIRVLRNRYAINS